MLVVRLPLLHALPILASEFCLLEMLIVGAVPEYLGAAALVNLLRGLVVVLSVHIALVLVHLLLLEAGDVLRLGYLDRLLVQPRILR
jgi:hypothetical protein